MADYLFFSLSLLLVISSLLNFVPLRKERHASIALVRVLAGLAILAAVYLWIAFDKFHGEELQIVCLLEIVLSMAAVVMVGELNYQIQERPSYWAYVRGIEPIAGGIFIALGIYFFLSPFPYRESPSQFVFPLYGQPYFYSLMVLGASLFVAWRLEAFVRNLSPSSRWEYKYLIVGGFVLCGALIWTTSYRLTMLSFNRDLFPLLGALLWVGWGLMVYAVMKNRLLNRKIFVSRKIVYSFLAPLLFAFYLLGLGIVSLFMRVFDLPFPFVFKWFLFFLGVVGVGIFLLSGGLRRRMHYFISTHFYVNKYEYRDEWLAFSQLLQRVLNGRKSGMPTGNIGQERLHRQYQDLVGDDGKGIQASFPRKGDLSWAPTELIPPEDPVILGLKRKGFYFSKGKKRRKEMEIQSLCGIGRFLRGTISFY